jgi:hypothetical protein
LVIIDEVRYARTLLETKPKYIKLKDLEILSKYYTSLEYKPAKIRDALLEYCYKNDKRWNIVLSGWKIKKALSNSKKYRIQQSFQVPITEDELAVIKSVGDYQQEKILFCMLFFSKFKKYGRFKIIPDLRPKDLGLFYSSLSLKDLFDLAGVKVKRLERLRIFKELESTDLVEKRVVHSRRKEYSVDALKYVYESSPVKIYVEDCDNPVLAYQRYCGEKIAGCSCGRLFLKKTSRHDLCPICWKKQRRKKENERVKRFLLRKNA